MGTRTWLGGNEISAYTEHVSFTKCMNSGPQDGTLKCTDLPVMLYNFDRHGDGEDACLTIDPWTKETDDDGDGTDIVHEIDVTDGVHSLHLKDASATAENVFDISYTFPTLITTGKLLRIKWMPCSALSDCAFVEFKIRDAGGTYSMWFRIGLNSGRFIYTVDGGSTFVDSGNDLPITTDVVNYLWLKDFMLTGVPRFYITNTTTPDTPSSFALSSTMDPNAAGSITGFSSIELKSPDSAHGYEGFESYNVGDIITTKSGWAIFSGGGADNGSTLTMRVEDGKVLHLHDASNPGYWDVYYTFPTGSGSTPGSHWIEFRFKFATEGTWGCTFGIGDAATTQRIWLRLNDTVSGNKLTSYNGSAWVNSGLALSAGTYHTVRITTTAANKHVITVDGVASAELTNYSQFSGEITRIRLQSVGAYENIDNYIDDIVTSWATAGPDVDPVEAYIYELWSDQTIDYDDMLDERVEIMVNDKHAWAGYLERIQKVGSTMYTLGCKDLMQRMADRACITSYKHATYQVNSASGSVVDNRILTVEDLDANAETKGIAQACVGLGGIIALNPADNVYADDNTSLKALAAPATDMNVLSGTYSDTHTSEATPVYHGFATAAGRSGYVTYTLKRANDAEVPIELLVEFKGKISFNSKCTLYMEFLDKTKTDAYGYDVWVKRALLFSGYYITTNVNIPPTKIIYTASDLCYDDGTNWCVQVRLTIQQDMPEQDMLAALYVDKIRMHMTARDEPYDPIEALIYNVDTSNNYLYIDTAPFLDNYVRSGDYIMVGPSVSQIMMDCVGDAFDMADISQSRRWLSQDLRGHTMLDVWRTCCGILGGYYYWTLDETTGKSTLKWINNTTSRRYYNDFYHTDVVDVDDLFSEFTEEITGSGSVHIVHVYNKGWYLNFFAMAGSTAKSTMTLPGSPTSVTLFDFSLFLEEIAYASTPLQIRFLAGTTERYKIVFNSARKPTCYGASTNSGVINHAFSATEVTLGRVVFTATNAAFYVKDPADDDYTVLDATRVITANDITIVELQLVAADPAPDPPVVRISNINVEYTIDTTGTLLTTQPNPMVTKEAKSIRSITVFGKDDLEWTELVDDTSPRDMVVVNDGLLTLGSVKSTAEAIAKKYASDSRSIRVTPVTYNDNYQIGNFYTVTAASDVVLRRAEYEHDWKNNLQRWVLELDTGETSGHELLKRGIANIKSAIETTKVSNAHT